MVFPTVWFDVLPLFAAIGFQGSWARGMGVNFLGANTYVPEVLSTGSGIYSPSGTKKYFRSLSANVSLSIATLSKIPKSRPGNISVVNTEKPMNADDESFYSDLFGDLFLFKELSKPEGTLEVCYNGSNICCSLTYKMADKRTDEMYAVGVFDGLHTKRRTVLFTNMRTNQMSRITSRHVWKKERKMHTRSSSRSRSEASLARRTFIHNW